MIEPDVPAAVVVDDRSVLEVGATAVAVSVWPGEGDAGPWVGEGAADLHALGVNLLGALERDKASGRAGQVVTVPVSGLFLQRFPATCRGRTWTSPGRAGPTPTSTRS